MKERKLPERAYAVLTLLRQLGNKTGKHSEWYTYMELRSANAEMLLEAGAAAKLTWSSMARVRYDRIARALHSSERAAQAITRLVAESYIEVRLHPKGPACYQVRLKAV